MDSLQYLVERTVAVAATDALITTNEMQVVAAREVSLPQSLSDPWAGLNLELKTITGEQDSVHSSIVLEDAQTVSILHVEDDEMVASVAREILEAQGWRVETCIDGNAALEKISGKVEYDLLLVDCDLPGVNGLQLITHARELDPPLWPRQWSFWPQTH